MFGIVDSKYRTRVLVSRPNTFLKCFVILKYLCWLQGCDIYLCLLFFICLLLFIFYFLYHNACPFPNIYKAKFQNSEVIRFGKWINFLISFIVCLCRAHVFQVRFHNKSAKLLEMKQNQKIPCFHITSITETTKGESTIAKFVIHIRSVGNRSALFFHLKCNTLLLLPCIYIALSISYI